MRPVVLPYWYDDEADLEPQWAYEAPYVTEEDNPVVAELYAVDGTVLVALYERSAVAFGFQSAYTDEDE